MNPHGRILLLDFDGELGAVVGREPSLLLEFSWNVAVDEEDCVALIVGVEQLGSEHVAAVVALAGGAVVLDLHGNNLRSERGSGLSPERERVAGGVRGPDRWTR